jgi:DNA-binding response OmpR family regulator
MARVFLSRLLVAEGIAVEVAENGDEARAWLAAGGFDLAFLDVDMPGGGALEIVSTLNAPAPPFVCALVKDDVERMRVEALGLGPTLLKPFAEDEVRAALAAALAADEPNP